MPAPSENITIVVRGGGDIATGVVQKFHRAGFNVLILEIESPAAIRRGVALSEAVYDGTAKVEDMICRKIVVLNEAEECWKKREVPIIIDSEGSSISEIKPAAVIDAIMAKRNLGTNRSMASITIALGPGFNAGIDVDVVIETKRGFDLGRLIFNGYAKPDTGVPAEVEGESVRRVLFAPASGDVVHNKQIGDIVEQGDTIFTIGDTESDAPFKGLLRGLIRENLVVSKGTKVADIDPRLDVDWRMISDKARCLGGTALEAYLTQKGGTVKE